jgi:simple sugar transport system permease protein
LLAVVVGAVMGWLYGLLMNAVRGSEMVIATYTGFSATALFCLVWLILPISNPFMTWMLGSGLRETIQLDAFDANHLLSNFLAFTIPTHIPITENGIPIPIIGGVHIPTGMLLFFLVACALVWLFFKSRAGIAISAAGANPMFATAAGLNVNRSRILASMLSTILGAVGILIYSQGFGFTQLYLAPLMMAFSAVAAILIGGATARRSKISHVIIGTFLFQGLITTSMPVANAVFTAADLSEIGRMIIQNGIILYALTQVKGGGK